MRCAKKVLAIFFETKSTSSYICRDKEETFPLLRKKKFCPELADEPEFLGEVEKNRLLFVD